MPKTIFRSAMKPNLLNVYGWTEEELGIILYALDHLSRTGSTRIHGIASELCDELNELYARNLSERAIHSIHSHRKRMESGSRHGRSGPLHRPVS